MIIDATNLIVGRFATVAAKTALLGEEVHIINAEKAVFSGAKQKVLADWQRVDRMGIPAKGPFIKRRPSMFVKRCIRGMLPYKQAKGRDALARIKCYSAVPEELSGKEAVTFEKADASKLPNVKCVTVGEICKLLGGKQ